MFLEKETYSKFSRANRNHGFDPRYRFFPKGSSIRSTSGSAILNKWRLAINRQQQIYLGKCVIGSNPIVCYKDTHSKNFSNGYDF